MGDNVRKRWVTCILIVIGIGIYFFRTFRPSIQNIHITEESHESEISDYSSMMSISEESTFETEHDQVFPVYICGEVKCPGIYQIDHTVYLYELIEMAGGLTQEADEVEINMVYVVDDAESIYVPSVNDEDRSDSPILQKVNEEIGDKEESNATDLYVNINSAGINELSSLPGIGIKTAEKIIDYRESVGRFTSIEQLLEVPGIGEGKLQQIRDFIYL